MKAKLVLVLLLWIIALLCSCELIKLTEKRRAKIEPNPKNSLGLVYLLVQEVKDNNIVGASKLFATEGTNINLENLIELEDKLIRFKRNISNREITYYKVDTLNISEHIIHIEFDYLFEYFFVTQKFDDYWLIRTFGEK